ncbi:MAG: PAS domain S-box protein [Desulfobacterales bacterium]|nr:PAS domain S-box protein [Desulfobacterales bacterium]
MAAKKTTNTKKNPENSADKAYKGADKRYRALLEFLPDPVIFVDLKSNIIYLNPAFTKVFGWSMEELEGKLIPFIPDHLKEETRTGIKLLFREKVIHGFETKRLTKEGKAIDVVLNGALYYEDENRPAGQVVILRDITREKRIMRRNEALYRIAKALPQYQSLNERLEFIIK